MNILYHAYDFKARGHYSVDKTLSILGVFHLKHKLRGVENYFREFQRCRQNE